MNLSSIDFLNSDWRDWHGSVRAEDRLLDPAWRDRFLARWGFGDQTAPSESVLQEMRDLRLLLHEVIREMPEGGLNECVLSRFNTYLERAPLIRRVSSVGGKPVLTLVPAQTGWSGVMAGLVASFVDIFSEDPCRLKVCANPPCRWVFYDDSRNNSRRWCANICGSFVRVRRFRARQQG